MVDFNFAYGLLCTTWVKTTEGLCQNKSILTRVSIRKRLYS